MEPSKRVALALFYCQRVPGGSGTERRDLEEAFQGRVRFFPLPCSGRLEPLHLLKALEEFADAAYIVTCPEAACRYFEGNRRAAKRVDLTKRILQGIGLEPERVGLVAGSKGGPEPLAVWAERLLERAEGLGPSPVFRQAHAA
jgi:coenzyme F420-reducing hydrogenase delta subunit